MRSAAIRRTVLTASAVSLALLATACGGEEKGGAAEAKADKPAAKALSAAELEKRVLAAGDVKDHKVEKPGKDDLPDSDALTVDKPGCEPVARALGALPMGKPAASVHRIATWESAKAKKGMPKTEDLMDMSEKEIEDATLDSMDITKTMLSLSSYDADAAEKALATLREARGTCAGGFTMSDGGEKQQVTKIVEEKSAAGGDALSWTVSTKLDGTEADTKLTVLRQGPTLATFVSFNIAAVTRGEAYPQPTEVITAQAAKLG
ncbi:hypothetical protein ACFQLX_03780 [Streptomyces polyrhachis]|uniref:Lipoprotein n=1 Tax=Streptomyces polyrhachis TaxID=1282885 RepID=A0ABW2GCK8_9ACTN